MRSMRGSTSWVYGFPLMVREILRVMMRVRDRNGVPNRIEGIRKTRRGQVKGAFYGNFAGQSARGSGLLPGSKPRTRARFFGQGMLKRCELLVSDRACMRGLP